MAFTFLAEQTLEFAADPVQVETYFPLIVGEPYIVVWDDVEYECIAAEVTNSGTVLPYLGNPLIASVGEDNGMPFMIVYAPAEAAGTEWPIYLMVTNSEGTHTVAIYTKALLPVIPFDEFVLDSTYGVYACNINSSVFTLTLGETYIVRWDGVSYTCVAQDVSALQAGALGLGNLANFGGTGNDEPFVIGWTPSGFTLFAFDDATSHTVGIYLQEEDTGGEEEGGGDESAEEEQEGIILKDRNGNNVVYYGIETVTFDTTTEGRQQKYTKGVKAEKTVELSLADGDQTVEPDEGTLLSKVTIEKPETLLPENVRNGVEVAGVTGEFIGDTEEATVELALADGNQVVSPSADGKVISKVTIVKPETLVPENIAKDVDIGGVVGTMEAGSGGGDGAYIEYTLNDSGNIIGAKMYNFTTIPYACFAYIDSLQSIDLSASPNITSIGGYAFYSCKALTSFTIPDGVTSIGAWAFALCTSLTSITIPESVTSIGSSAFQNCSILPSITLPSGITEIAGSTFYYCYKLASITIPDGVTKIGGSAFRNCTSLTSITIPKNVTNIGIYAFYQSSALTAVTFEDTTTWYRGSSEGATTDSLSSTSLADPSTAARWLMSTYYKYYWTKV